MENIDARAGQPLTRTGTRPHPRKPGAPPTRQALFPYAGADTVTLGALNHAIRHLQELGFTIDQSRDGTWELGWPGSPLRIWRHSPGQLCHFARDRASDYAKRARNR